MKMGNGSIKVAYLIEQCWHKTPGGTAVAAVNVAEEISQLEEIELIGIAANHRRVPRREIPEKMTVVNSKLPRQILYETWNRLGMPKAENLVESVDLVHASGGAVPSTDLPLVATVHDLSWRQKNDWFPSRGKRFAEAWLEKTRKAQILICSSVATSNDLLGAGFDEKKIRVVPLGVKKIDVKDEEVELLLEKNSLSEPFVLWVGTIEPRKNLLTLIEAMQRIPDVPLVLVGPTGWETDLTEITRPISNRVKIIGEVDEHTKNVWYKAATVFCYPSLMEGFGLPVLEAMSHKTPVVTSSSTATAEVVQDTGLTVDPRSPEAIAEAITKLLDDSELAEGLAMKASLRAEKFTWQNTALKTVEIYREVLN